MIRDIIFTVGVTLAAVGLWWLWPPVCLVAVGAGLVWISIRLTETPR